jgi:hypothetical protein
VRREERGSAAKSYADSARTPNTRVSVTITILALTLTDCEADVIIATTHSRPIHPDTRVTPDLRRCVDASYGPANKSGEVDRKLQAAAKVAILSGL